MMKEDIQNDQRKNQNAVMNICKWQYGCDDVKKKAEEKQLLLEDEIEEMTYLTLAAQRKERI